MADIYNTNKIIVPQDLPEILTPINNRQNIVIEKNYMEQVVLETN